MSKRSQRLRALVTERLTAAAEEIFALVESTIAEYEKELCRSKEENQMRQQLLEENQRRQQLLMSPQVLLHRTDVKQESVDDPQLHEDPCFQVKEEDPEELAITLPQDDMSFTKEMHQKDTTITTEMHREDTGSIQTWTVLLTDEVQTDKGGLLKEENMEQVSKIVLKKNSRGKLKACSACNMIFLRSYDLKKHETIHMRAKPYSCSICNRSFFGEKYVKIHMMQHTGQLPFQCPQCEKRFGTKGALNLHIKTIHSHIRPFSCSVCGRTFKTKGHLKEHMLRHTEFRPLRCPVCGKGYWRNRELLVHVAKHTNDKAAFATTVNSN